MGVKDGARNLPGTHLHLLESYHGAVCKAMGAVHNAELAVADLLLRGDVLQTAVRVVGSRRRRRRRRRRGYGAIVDGRDESTSRRRGTVERRRARGRCSHFHGGAFDLRFHAARGSYRRRCRCRRRRQVLPEA